MQRTTIILACLLICTNCFAQQYPFVHYTPKDGLVNSRVKKAYQDSKGRMYFLTYGGLSVYNGARFKNYTTQNGLPLNIINDVLEIGDDSLLIATNSHNLNLLTKGKIELVQTNRDTCPIINQFYRHDDNKIYLSSDNGLFLLEKNKIKELNISQLTRLSPDAPNLGNIAGIGNFLVITTNEMKFNKGFFVYDIEHNRISDVQSEINCFLFVKDEKNRIWINTEHKLYIVDTIAIKKGKLSLTTPGEGLQQIHNYSTTNLAFNKNAIWLVYRNKEYRNIEIRHTNGAGNISAMPLPVQATNSDIKNIFLDRENNIWLSNDGEGIFKITNSPLQAIEKPFGNSIESNIDAAFYNNGVTWYSTTKNLVRKSAGQLDEFKCNLERSPILFYENGKKVLGRNFRNIYQGYINDSKKTIEFQKIISLPDSNFFGRLLMDPYGAIISFQNKAIGIWKNNKLISQLPVPKNENIEGLSIDNNNLLWVVKRAKETRIFSLHPEDPSNYLQPVFTISPDQIIGSPRCFMIDKKDLIWMGTRDDGLIGYKLQDNKLAAQYRFNTSNGLSDNFVTSIAFDLQNNVIVGTQSGLDRIIRISENLFRIENLSKSNNLFAYIKDVWVDSSGLAYALTAPGTLLQISQSVKETAGTSPQLLLEEIKVNAQTTSKEKTSFKHRENNISFLLAAPSFIDEKQVTYSYLLEGSGNKQWSDTAAANSQINFSNLSVGKYSLRMKAFFPSSAYPPAELAYTFEVTPPWWKTWWFRSIVGIFMIGLLILVSRFYYRRKLEKQMAILEKQQAIEKERTRIATDMHDDLGAGLSRIKFLSETIGIKKQQHEPIEEDVNKIREYSHEMIAKMGEIVWALNEKNDTLSDLLSYTRAYAVEYLLQHNIRCKVESPEQFPAGFVSGEFRRNVYLTVKEALHNIVKHSRASEVIIKISAAHRLYIEIHDNGSGFNKKMIRPFSNGLTNMRSRIKEIKGEFKIENGNGTIIKINVPLIV
jgi:signal transduction histidine kinase